MPSTCCIPPRMPCSDDAMPHEACRDPGGPAGARGCPCACHTSRRPSHRGGGQHGLAMAGLPGGGQALHLCLTLRDAAAVMEAGWGERTCWLDKP